MRKGRRVHDMAVHFELSCAIQKIRKIETKAFGNILLIMYFLPTKDLDWSILWKMNCLTLQYELGLCYFVL